jgi:phosphoribosylamine---glycine ligase
VIRPTVDGMAKDGVPFKGVLYAGLMIDEARLNVLEFNVRFGDPECQPLLAMLKSDLLAVLIKAANGELGNTQLEWYPGSAICVVQAAGGYPGSYEKGDEISGLDDADAVADVIVFHAGTRKDGDKIVTNGGRVLGVTGRGSTLADARDKTYRACDRISWNGMRLRRDIGHRALK